MENLQPAKSKKELEVLDEVDYAKHFYGDLPFNQVKSKYKPEFTKIQTIDDSYNKKDVLIQGYLQQVRKTGKQVFLVIRNYMSTIQCIAYKDDKIFQFIANVQKESLVEVSGCVKIVEKPVESCTQSSIEIHVKTVFVVSRAKSRLPLQIEDLMRNEKDTNLAKVNLDTKLNNRVLDLRTITNKAIFKIRNVIELSFQKYLISREFEKIQPPSLVAGSSEGGADVFQVTYYNEKAYLAQSPQLYKQMGIASGWPGVYVVGQVWRAENSNTHRHLTEFTGLDLEMRIHNHYHEVLDLICDMMITIFRKLERACAHEISIVNKQFEDIEPFKWLEPTLVLTYAEGVAMLRDAGVAMGDFDDLSTLNEKLLGQLVRKKFGTDFYVLDRFPLAVRPFYTMPDPVDGRYSNSYDIFMRGEEVLSGSQRIHETQMLRESALKRGVNLDSIKDYLDAFEYGCGPHGGGGLGLERVVMLYLGLSNIRLATMFPRDPHRLRP